MRLFFFFTFSCEGGPRILRLILGRSHGFPVSPSCSAATGSGSLPCEGVQETLDLLGDDFRNFLYMLRVPFGRRLAPVAWQHGRYGPEGQFYRGMAVAYARLDLLVPLLALIFLRRCQALMWVTWCLIKVIYIPVVAQRYAHRRSRQWHMQVWFCWVFLALCSFTLSSGP